MGFKVYNADGEDVTESGDTWVIDTNGTLYYLTNDIDRPLVEAEGYWYSMN